MRNLTFFTVNRLDSKMDMLVKMSWELLQKKIQYGLVKINKEASLQLQFANILQELLSVSRYSNNENVEVILEDSIKLQDGSTQEIDVLLDTMVDGQPYKVAIEMKCYKEYAASGGKRGAIDIFCKDVYEDIASLENYRKCDSSIKKTYFLAMTDYANIIHPKNKDAKYWNYDVSDGFELRGPKDFDTPIGGKEVSIHIDGQYKFEWSECIVDSKKSFFLIL